MTAQFVRSAAPLSVALRVADHHLYCLPILFLFFLLMLGIQEHTILLRPTVKEVVSRGDDY